jgi:hypothetical protein
MIFEWKDFVDIARHLSDVGGKHLPDEAAYRSAVNRAYYGAYGHSTKYAIHNFRFIQFEDGRDNARLRNCFKEEGKRNPKMVQIALNLNELHKWRKDCDYHYITYDPKAPDQMALEAIDDAQEIIDILV